MRTRIFETIKSIIKFDEADHPRDENGRFTSGGGSSASGPKEPKAPKAPKAPLPSSVSETGNRAGIPSEMSPEVRAVISECDQKYDVQRPEESDTNRRFRTDDGSFTPARAAMHKEIVDSYVSNAVKATGQPEMMFMGGGPASGKSTAIESGFVTKPENSVEVNPDHLKAKLPEFGIMSEQRVAWGSGYVHEESSLLSKAVMRGLYQKQANITLDTTGNNSADSVVKKCSEARAAGYKVRAEYATLSTELAQKIAVARAAKEGRAVDPEVVRETHEKVSRIFPEAVARGAFDEARLWDNEIKGQPRLVASAVGKNLTIHAPDLWEKFLAKGKNTVVKADDGIDKLPSIPARDLLRIQLEVTLGTKAPESEPAEFKAWRDQFQKTYDYAVKNNLVVDFIRDWEDDESETADEAALRFVVR